MLWKGWVLESVYHKILQCEPYFSIDSCGKWRCVLTDIFSVHSCNKNTLSYPSEIIIGTQDKQV
jgi:hypothetical protein